MDECSANVGQPILAQIYWRNIGPISITNVTMFSQHYNIRPMFVQCRFAAWNFRKNFSLENSKNLTGPSLGEIFEKISVSKIRKTSQVPPQEALPNVPSLTNVWLMLRTPTFVAIFAAQYWAKLNFWTLFTRLQCLILVQHWPLYCPML